MNCSVCGTMIPVGQAVCPNCGNPAQQSGGFQPQQPQGGFQPQQPMGGFQPQQPQGGFQPQQPMGGFQPQQPMGGFQPQQPMGGFQPQQPMGGGINAFFSNLAGDVMMIVRLVGALLLIIAPFFSWLSIKITLWGYTEKESRNMFGIVSDADIGIYAFFAIMLILLGLVLVAWELGDYIPQIGNIKYKLMAVPYVDIIIVAVALLFVILAATNGMDGNIKEAKELLEDYTGHVNHGVGPWIGYIGVACAAVPRILNLANINVGSRRY